MKQTNGKELLTAEEVGERVRVSPDTVKEWARAGRVPCYRLGRKTIRFDLAEVIAALRDACPVRGGDR